MLVERVTVTEHLIAVGHVPASATEPGAGRHASEPVA
jgi:hypothetical protein